MAYMLSMRAAMIHHLSDEQVQQLRALVNERIARDGAIRIRKGVGMFIATKDGRRRTEADDQPSSPVFRLPSKGAS